MADNDEELRHLLDDLDDTLADLREELDGSRRRGPPTPGELLRLTEEHTIPTVVATLEATIRALELLRAFLRLVSPERRASTTDHATTTPVTGVRQAFEDLRTALEEADLPPDPEARELVEDARDLSREVERRLEPTEATDEATTDGVEIGVEEATEDESEDDDPAVDVEAELRSIREDVRGGDERSDEDGADETGDGQDAGT